MFFFPLGVRGRPHHFSPPSIVCFAAKVSRRNVIGRHFCRSFPKSGSSAVWLLLQSTPSLAFNQGTRKCFQQELEYHRQQCTHVVTGSDDELSSTHLKAIKKYQLPVVGPDFIWNSVKERRLLQINNNEPPKTLPSVTDDGDNCQRRKDTTVINGSDASNDKNASSDNNNLDEIRWFSNNDEDVPYFPEDFEIAKYNLLEKVAAHGEYVLVELQCFQQQCDYPFRIYRHCSVRDGKQKQFIPTKTSEKARRNYELCIENLKKEGFELRTDFPNEAEYLASWKLQEILVSEAISSSTLSEGVAKFVELIWIEALGVLDLVLAKPVTSISLNDVSKAEGVLLRTKKALNDMKSPSELSAMMMDFYQIIPHKDALNCNVTLKLLSNKQDLCQLIRDMLNVQEINLSTPNPSSLSKYQALRCRIDALDAKTEEFHRIKQRVDQDTSKCPVEILEIYKVGRITEAAGFESRLGNVQSLIHASSPGNFVGILSRGLLLPKMAVEEHGLERTDFGNLGSGIYFSDSLSTSIKYSQTSKTDGARLFLICDVALGTCWNTHQTNFSLTAPPPGYDSVHGVSKKKDRKSAFEGDEFVVYRTSQVRIRYVVKFSLVHDKVKEFHPVIRTELEDELPSLDQPQPEDYEMPNQDKREKVISGLLDRSGNPIPLKNLHIKGKIIDFAGQIVIFQTYENQTDSPIEAKYVFPLDDTAAVCGFEAFIKGKHIIGEVKEKEKAHKEYRDAVIQGHGAYLMDQDAPDIFTVSVGNLPPSTKVLIKITYVTELNYDYGRFSFHLPAALTPWQQDKALNENTQDAVRKVAIRQVGTNIGEFSLQMSVEMPFKIESIRSWTHELKIKKTDCKAVVCTKDASSLGMEGFTMDIVNGNVYLPRMWIEKHPDKKSEACMLVFQPEFDTPFDPIHTSGETVICLDCSNSMAGSKIQHAKQIALSYLNSCYDTEKLTVIKFGTNFIEFPYNFEDFEAMKQFIMSATATMGNSDFWKTLHYLSLLYPSKGKRNILFISDGHIQNEAVTLQLVKQNAKHTRIFTCGVGPAANRHMLRSLSQYGAGAFEYFDEKSKYDWERKVMQQQKRRWSPECSAISIKWQQFDTDAPELMYAPAQIQSLFEHERLLVYGFISNCTQAALYALLNSQELQTIVSTTELQKTTGTILHKLAARAFIRDYEQGILHEDEAENEMKKQLLKSMIIKLSMENSIVTQFTSFVAIEKRDEKEDQITDSLDVLELVSKENVDILPYMQYEEPKEAEKVLQKACFLKVDSLTSWENDLCDKLSFSRSGSDFLSSLELGLLSDESSTEGQKFTPQAFDDFQAFEDSHVADDQVLGASSVLSSVFSDSPAKPSFVPAKLKLGSLPSPPLSSYIPRGLPFSSLLPMTQTVSSLPTSMPSADAPLNLQTKMYMPTSCISSPAMSLSDQGGFSMPNILERAQFQGPSNAFYSTGPSAEPRYPRTFGFGAASLLPASQTNAALLSREIRQSLPPPPPPPSLQLFSQPCFTLPGSSLFGSAQPWAVSQSFKPLAKTTQNKMDLQNYPPKRAEKHFLPKHAPGAVSEQDLEPEMMHKAVLEMGKERAEEDLASKDVHLKKKKKKKSKPIMKRKIVSENKQLGIIFWPRLFQLQNEDGFWELTFELGMLLELDVDHLVNVTLAKKGIQSLGPKGKEKLLRLIATLLVLQVVRFKQLQGLTFKSLTKLSDSPPSWALVPAKKATEWARRTEREFPVICQRLELGKDWDSATKNLLRIDTT
uniref:Poly [ADP-ribose] polymerase n=1 Tax=Anolis carolinensis TaxID=28377 RepID=A0A803T0M7_ANOCA